MDTDKTELRDKVIDVYRQREYIEVVGWRKNNKRGLEKMKRQAEREGGQLLILPSENSEEVGALADPTLNLPSDSKDTASEPKNQEVAQKNVAAPEIPTLKNGQPDYNAMSPEMFVEQYVTQFGEKNAENIARNNIKAADKEIARLGKEIGALTDPNKLPKLKAKLDVELTRKARYTTILDLLGLSENAQESNSERVSRLKKENTDRIAQLFPDGLPNVESVILADIANGNKIRWADKEVNGAVVSRRLGAELGLADSNAERNRRIGLLSNDAPTPDEYAEQLRERLDAMGIRYEESELRDKVIDTYASVGTLANAWKALEDLAANQQTQEEALDYEEEQMRRAYERERQGFANEDGGYKLSSEVDENGRQFVLSSSGNVEFGEISEESGLTPAPILLSEGMITNKATNDGYGLVHIEARHGDQIRKAGYKSVVDFIEDVAQNYEVIKEGNVRDGNNTYLLQITDKHNNTLMVELSGDGTYWNINTAGIFKTSYGKNRKEVYNRHTTAKQPAETGEVSRNAEPSGTQADPSMITTPTLNSSDNKNTTSAPNNQEVAQKNVDDPGLIGDEELSIEDETPFSIGRKPFGGNSGYVGHSMSRRAAEAREEGRYPKTDFKRVYHIPEDVLRALVENRIIDNTEWHHTSSYGNRTTFYGWENQGALDYYQSNKDAIDQAVKKGEGVGAFSQGFAEAIEQWETEAIERATTERSAQQQASVDRSRRAEALQAYLSEVVPEVFTASNGVEVHTDGKYDPMFSTWSAYKNGERLSKRKGKRERDAAIAELKALIKGHITAFDAMFRSDNAQQLATDAAIMALQDAGIEVVQATPEMVEEALQKRDVQLQAVEQKFNEQLAGFSEENAAAVIFNLGLPSPMLIAGGVANKPIRLYGGKLLKKMRKHGFTVSELKGLPTAIANPIAVFDNYRKPGNRSILTELKTADGNFLVSVDVGVGSDIDFDIVKTVFGKDGGGILNWINKGYLTIADKEKALAYLRISALIAEASNKQELDSSTKIVENFEHPKIVPENAIRNDVNLRLQQQSAIDDPRYD